jgi:hypothetical protein
VLVAEGADALVVDPATRTMAPLEPADMQPVAEPPETRGGTATVQVTLERQLDEPGPPILGLPTRHYVYRLGFQQGAVPSGATQRIVMRSEERHEFWATPVPQGERSPKAWQELRAVEDAGWGSPWRETREAMAAMHEHGLMLRQIVERRGPEQVRVIREVTALSRQSISPETFRKPVGFTQSEFLAPAPGNTTP